MFCLRGNFAYLNHFDHLHQWDIILDFYTISFSIVLNISFLVSLGCHLLCPQVKYVQLLQIALIYYTSWILESIQLLAGSRSLNLNPQLEFDRWIHWINTIVCWISTISIPESERTTGVRSLDCWIAGSLDRCIAGLLDRWINASTIVRRGYVNSSSQISVKWVLRLEDLLTNWSESFV